MSGIIENFDIFLADTPESKDLHFKTRYEVYCDEMGFENKEDFPLELECDENDLEGKSVHFVAVNNEGRGIGAMRLIFKNNSSLLPVEKNCTLHEEIKVDELFGAVEISRLCLTKSIRRSINDIDPPHGISEEENQLKESDKMLQILNHKRLSRMVLWGLLHAAVEYGRANNIKNSYFMTSIALAKVLRREGMNLIDIGEPCEHKGKRFPFKVNTADAYQSDIWKQEHSKGYRLFSDLDSSIPSVA